MRRHFMGVRGTIRRCRTAAPVLLVLAALWVLGPVGSTRPAHSDAFADAPVEEPASTAKESARVYKPMPEHRTPPPLEMPMETVNELRQWKEILKLLPKDSAGGADWIRALKEGIVTPRPNLPTAPPPSQPLTLDNLAPAINDYGAAPAFFDVRQLLEKDVKLVPSFSSFFEVRFPHTSHMLWLNCSSCHPGIPAKKGVGMQKIFEGEYCGKCHGKVSFEPETGCPRCHVNLAFPPAEPVWADLTRAHEAPVPADPALIRRGEKLYHTLCVRCHGEEGDGKGPFAPFLDPKPRDFVEGTFKFRTTESGSLPVDFDLYRTITMGLRGTSMPSWYALPSRDRWALAHYIKTFSEIFEEEEPEEPIEILEPPVPDPELLAMGSQRFREMKCWDCHGRSGDGNGPGANDLEDDWGYPIRPADFTMGFLKVGARVEDIFRTISTGLDGTPMPSYFDSMEDNERWGLSYYILSLGKEMKGFGLQGNIHFPRESARKDIPTATFPHWFHRIRFKCATCHPHIFRMKRGANPISMVKLQAGEFCGKCHNGRIAWVVGFFTCFRCHRS